MTDEKLIQLLRAVCALDVQKTQQQLADDSAAWRPLEQAWAQVMEGQPAREPIVLAACQEDRTGEAWLVRWGRRVDDAMTELGRLVVDATGALGVVGRWLSPPVPGAVCQLRPEGPPIRPVILPVEVPGDATSQGPVARLEIALWPAQPDRFDLQVTALAGDAAQQVDGLRLVVASAALEQPVVLVSDELGMFRHDANPATYKLTDLPFAAYRLSLQQSGAAEYVVEIVDVRELCRVVTPSHKGPAGADEIRRHYMAGRATSHDTGMVLGPPKSAVHRPSYPVRPNSGSNLQLSVFSSQGGAFLQDRPCRPNNRICFCPVLRT